ncbi:MAG: peroxiredoxin [Polyangiaceae bacterium]
MFQAFRTLGIASLALLGPAGCNRAQATSSMLAVGQPAPDLSFEYQGKERRLRDQNGHLTLVYFYPKDGTPGCTKEACAIRDVWNRFEARDIGVIGVSRDDASSHERFAKEHRLPFPLVADSDGRWATAFGVPNRNGKSARVSFLLDRKGTIAHIYPEVDPGIHANEVLRDAEKVQ